MSITMPAIDIRGLTKVYKPRSKNPITAVNNLNLSIDAGQVFGFLGANGAGKTTTIKMICGLVTPTTGAITLNGIDTQQHRGKSMLQIGAVLEGTRNIYWRLTALQNVMYFGQLKGVSGKTVLRRAETLLGELGLWDRRNDKVRTFSRGMQQKVAIACALIADPPIVLLDEPTLGLDVQAALTVKQWIRHIAEDQNKTVILTTHQLDMAQQLCQRIAIINHGKLLTNKPTDELLQLFHKEFYEIKVRGLQSHHMEKFSPNLTLTENGRDSLLAGSLNSTEDLYRVIDHIRELELQLISITPVEPDLETAFINTINAGEETA